jgi:hypothetical protein
VIEDAVHVQDEQEPEPASPSLSSRMTARHEELARQTTGRFPVPGWDDVLEVELRAVGIRQSTKIVQRSQRVRDDGTRQLYVTADLVTQATVGFWEVPENGGGKAKPLEGETWASLAARLDDCPDSPTPRQALLFLVPEERLLFLYTQWESWMREASRDVDEETMRDFTRTG